MYPVTQHGTVSGTQLGALHLRRQLTLALWVELTEGHLQLPHVVHDLAPDLFVDDCLAVHFPEKYVQMDRQDRTSQSSLDLYSDCLSLSP